MGAQSIAKQGRGSQGGGVIGRTCMGKGCDWCITRSTRLGLPLGAPQWDSQWERTCLLPSTRSALAVRSSSTPPTLHVLYPSSRSLTVYLGLPHPVRSVHCRVGQCHRQGGVKS